MTINEIFSKLSTHMIQGMMVHEQLMNSYRFLSLFGYAKCHEYHYLEETIGHIRLLEFVTNRYDFLVPPGRPEDPEIIPEKWYYKERRQSVPAQEKVEAIKATFNEWIRWESETLSLYKAAYQDLFSANELDAANFINEYITDVSRELIYAKNELIAKESMNYDMPSILEEQKDYEKLFSKKIRKSRKG